MLISVILISPSRYNVWLEICQQLLHVDTIRFNYCLYQWVIIIIHKLQIRQELRVSRINYVFSIREIIRSTSLNLYVINATIHSIYRINKPITHKRKKNNGEKPTKTTSNHSLVKQRAILNVFTHIQLFIHFIDINSFQNLAFTFAHFYLLI